MRNTVRVDRASAVLGLAMTVMAAGSLTGCGGIGHLPFHGRRHL